MGKKKKYYYKKKQEPKVYQPKSFAKNFNYDIIETKTLQEGLVYLPTLNDQSQRKKHLVALTKNDPSCVCCGKRGTHFGLGKGKRSKNASGGDLHWDLYTDDGTAMSIDHIHPRSKGGKDCIENYQLMCIACNNFKSNIPERLLPYMALLNLGAAVIPMQIADKPYLQYTPAAQQLPASLYEPLQKQLTEVCVRGQYRYFLIENLGLSQTLSTTPTSYAQ